VTEVHDTHRQRDLVASRAGGVAVPVPPLVGEAQRFPNLWFEVEPSHEHVGHLAARREVVDRPVVGSFLERPCDLFALLGGPAGRRELHHGVPNLGRIRRVEHERPGEEGHVIAEDGGDLVRVARATDVAEQRDPVDGFAQLPVEARLLTQRRPKEARPELRLERLAERVVLPESERRDELTQAERRTRNRETSRCVVARGRYTIHPPPSPRKEAQGPARQTSPPRPTTERSTP
jgi:hypothetical protein